MDNDFEAEKINLYVTEHANYNKIKSFLETKLKQYQDGESSEIIGVLKKVSSLLDAMQYYDFHKKERMYANRILKIVLDATMELDAFYSSPLSEQNYNREIASLKRRHQKETFKYNKKLLDMGMKEIEANIQFPSHPSDIYLQAINKLKLEADMDKDTANMILDVALKMAPPPITKSIKQRINISTKDFQTRVSQAIERDQDAGEISFKSFITLPEIWDICTQKTRKQAYTILLSLAKGLPFILKQQSQS